MIYIHFAEGTEEIEFVTIIDLLRRSSLDAVSVSITGKTRVAGAHGIVIETDTTFEEADYDKCDMIVLPGGMPGTLHMAQHSGLTDMIKSFNASGKRLAAICAAPMVFAGCGILSGKKAVIYPGMEEHLGDAEVSSSRVQTDGNIITSQGPGTAMEFALEIIRTVKGEAAADEIRRELLMI